MAEDPSSKTEEPTPKRLSKGREEGQVVSSQEIKTWLMLLATAFAIVMMAPRVMRQVTVISEPFIESSDATTVDLYRLQHLFADLSIELAIVLAPLVGLLTVIAIASNVGQSGLVYSPKKIGMKLSKISILAGFKRMFGLRGTIEFVKGIIKLAIVSFVAMVATLPFLTDLDLSPGFEVETILDRLGDLALALLVGTLAVMTVIAVLDYIFQRHEFMRQMRMTKQEVRDEYKQAEGDPLIKARIRRLRTERARKRMMAAVPRADVVITNPTHYAVALEYKMDTMPAPKLLAKGMDEVARKIREIAEEHQVPIVENPPLARALFATVELDQEIPPEHYKAVAEVIGYVMRLKGRLPKGGGERIGGNGRPDSQGDRDTGLRP